MARRHVEAFEIGFQFAMKLRECYDARDVGRVLTSDCFPPEVQDIANRMDGFRSLDHGTQEAMNLLRELFSRIPPTSMTTEEMLAECRNWKLTDNEVKRLEE